MKIEFVRWDNSLALRVPKALAQELGVSEGTRAHMTVANGCLIVRVAAAEGRRRYSLEHLTSALTEENRHRETDWASTRGNEMW